MTEIKLESNLPIIFLTILVIAIVVIGFLEIRKINFKINQLTLVLQNNNRGSIPEKPDIKKIVPPNNSTSDSNKSNDILVSNNEVNSNVVDSVVSNSDVTNKVTDSRTKEMEINKWQEKSKEDIIDEINNMDDQSGSSSGSEVEEDVEDVDGVGKYENTMVMDGGQFSIGGGLFLPTNSVEMFSKSGNLDIEEIVDDNKSNESTEESSEGEDEREGEDEGEGGEVTEGSSESGESSNEEGSVNSGAGEDDNDSIIEVIDLKTLNNDQEFEKEKVIVDDSYSVSQLKQLCKNMGLSVSGNKTTLISRIMDNQ